MGALLNVGFMTERRAAAVHNASFQAQLAQLRHMEFDDARQALTGSDG